MFRIDVLKVTEVIIIQLIRLTWITMTPGSCTCLYGDIHCPNDNNTVDVQYIDQRVCGELRMITESGTSNKMWRNCTSPYERGSKINCSTKNE